MRPGEGQGDAEIQRRGETDPQDDHEREHKVLPTENAHQAEKQVPLLCPRESVKVLKKYSVNDPAEFGIEIALKLRLTRFDA